MRHWALLGILTLIFKDITLYQDIRLVTQILKQTERVEGLAMRSAKKGYIIYEGRFEGGPEALSQILEESIGEQLKMKALQTEENLEITFYPSPPS